MSAEKSQTPDEWVPRPRGLLGASAALAVSAIYAGLRTPSLMQDYRDLFRAMAVKPLPVTKLVLAAPNLWWVIATPAVLLFIWIAMRSQVTPTERTRMKAALISTIVFAVVVYGFVAYALYMTLFKLNAAI